MTRARLSALFLTISFTGLVAGDTRLSISVWQVPKITAKEGTNVSLTCQIKANNHALRIMVKWWKDNQTEVKSEGMNTTASRSSLNGSVFINATLNLSVHSNHTHQYFCSAWVDTPGLGSTEYGKGTHVYMEPNLPFSVGDPANSYNYTWMWSLLSGLGFVLLIISITSIIHIYYKGDKKIEPGATDALVAASSGSPCQETHEPVVYAALNIPRDSIKSRNEKCAAPAPTSVSCTEDSVTYSVVHIKKRQNDEEPGIL